MLIESLALSPGLGWFLVGLGGGTGEQLDIDQQNELS